MHDTHENGGFGLWVGLREAREGCSRRRRCAAVRFDAANEPCELLGEVVCGALPATAVVVPGFLAQSTHLEPEAMCEAEVEVAAVAVALAPAFELWYYERLR